MSYIEKIDTVVMSMIRTSAITATEEYRKIWTKNVPVSHTVKQILECLDSSYIDDYVDKPRLLRLIEEVHGRPLVKSNVLPPIMAIFSGYTCRGHTQEICMCTDNNKSNNTISLRRSNGSGLSSYKVDTLVPATDEEVHKYLNNTGIMPQELIYLLKRVDKEKAK
jgi:hypothetical protein